jgi:hypothetical protein
MISSRSGTIYTVKDIRGNKKYFITQREAKEQLKENMKEEMRRAIGDIDSISSYTAAEIKKIQKRYDRYL